MNMYRIEWISRLTNAGGNGAWFLTSEKMMLEKDVVSLNRQYLGIIHHWVKMKDYPEHGQMRKVM